ncbi:monocyte chemotactic protein 1B [Misgurnus anguillicaudatus]|uniref:monocyte chemotactic protein 1B n=1 Tax=Misgurnus anguillicaudatus TaxID=75329 RepID=UPI0024357649|nr:monocyte chemotactic protein 1B [Misgurnus anguillicaudatus]
MMSRFILTSSTLLLLLCIWVNSSESSPVRCCTKYSTKSFPLQLLKDYKQQDDTMTCNIPATVFITVKNRQICANPNDLWVQNAISHIQKKRKL